MFCCDPFCCAIADETSDPMINVMINAVASETVLSDVLNINAFTPA